MRVNDGFDDGETQPGALAAGSAGGVAGVEAFKQTGQMFLRHLSRIGHTDTPAPAFIGQPHLHLATGFSMVQGV